MGIDLLVGPFAEFGFLRRALVGCIALALSAPPLGVFLVLRRMSLTADVLAHGMLPGVAVGFLVAGLSVTAMSLGGLLAGLAVVVGAGALSRATGGREDSALAGLYLISLALGVAIVSTAGGAVDLSRLLFGSVLGVDDAALWLMAGTAAVTLAWLSFAWRPLVLECFDPGHGAAVRARGGPWHLSFLGLVTLNVIAAAQAMGTLMSVGLMMLPAAAARFLARSIGGMVYAAVGIALASGFGGLVLSFHADLPSGASIVLCAGGAWVLAALFGPVDGIITRRIARSRHLAG